MESTKKQTKGRQKIEMKKIENEDDRLITFSKRRSGIYKKASELATLCGAEVGVVVFSPAGKPFSFAHPSIETIANKFLQETPHPADHAHPLVEAHRRVRINELNQQHNQLIGQLEAEKERGKALEKMKKARGGGGGWWEARTEDLGTEELMHVESSFGELYESVCHQLKERGVIGSASSSTLPSFNGGEQEASPFNFMASGSDPCSSSFPSSGFGPPSSGFCPPSSGFGFGPEDHHP